jgi:hypothetical protein
MVKRYNSNAFFFGRGVASLTSRKKERKSRTDQASGEEAERELDLAKEVGERPHLQHLQGLWR